MNERELVLDALLAITRDGEYSHIVLKNYAGSVPVSG